MGHLAGKQAAPVDLATNGYQLRSLTPRDVTERFIKWLNSGPMLAGLNLASHAFNHAQLSSMIERCDNQRNYFIGIFHMPSNLLLGFYELEVNLPHRTAYLTAGIGEQPYLGKDIFWATIDALLDHAFTDRSIDKISTNVHTRNLPMVYNFLNNLRFVFELCLRQECLKPDGTRADMYVFSAFRPSTGPQPAHGPYAAIPWQ